MQSILLITKDPTQKEEYITAFIKQHAISQFDCHIYEPTGASFGIEDIRLLQKTAYLSPQQSKEKLLLISNAELLTTEAQNALLKLLEEPPQHTCIILTSSADVFLPTITSRCKIITLQQDNQTLTTEEKEILTEQVAVLEQGSVSEKLALAEKIAANKENLSAWFEHFVLFLREKMLARPEDKQLLAIILTMQEAYKNFQTTNVSPRVILEHAFLSF